MAVSLVVLLSVGAGLLLQEFERAARSRAEKQLLDTTRALSSAIDGELRRAIGILETLRASNAVRQGDWRSVDRQAREAFKESRAWIVVTDRDGQQRVNTRLAPDAPLPLATTPPEMWSELDRGKPRACNLTRGAVEAHIVCVDVPITREGKVRYAMSVVMQPGYFQPIIDHQHLDEGRLATIVDRNGTLIWRNIHPERFIGRAATGNIRQAIRTHRSGVRYSTSLDGVSMLTGFERSPLSGWTLVAGMPTSGMRAGLDRAAIIGLTGALACLALAAAGAILVARRISGASAELTAAAIRFRDHEPTAYAPTGLREIDDVGNLLEEAFAARAASEERFALAQEIGGIGAWDWDVTQDRGIVTDRYREMHGLTHIDRPLQLPDILAVIHPDDLTEFRQRLDVARSRAEPSDIEYRVAHPDGSVRWIAAIGRPIFEKGAYVRALGIVRDITNEREAQQTLERLNHQLEDRVAQRTSELREAEAALLQAQKLESLGQLTGGVAHDFNNLLTPILGTLELLDRRAVGIAPERRLVGGALQSAEKARALVQRLLAFARRQPLQPAAVDAGTVVHGIADLVETTVGARVRLDLAVEAGLPRIHADSNQLEMAILNLAVNARDAMPNGGDLVISVALAAGHPARPTSVADGDYVRLSVRDTGVGMDKDTARRALEPFFSTKRVGEGTGLGLSMVHGLVRQLGGDLSIETALGHGTTIHLWLPVSRESPRHAGTRPPETLTPQHGVVLLVDDDFLVRESTAFMLEELGFSVIHAASAEEAQQRVLDGAAFDLLVTDFIMPGASGGDLIRWIEEKRPGIGSLLITGYAAAEALPPGVRVLAKPFRAQELAAALSAITIGASVV